MSEIRSEGSPQRFVSSAFHKSPQPPRVAPNGAQHQAAMCRLQPLGAAESHLPTGRRMSVAAALPTRIVGYNWALVAQQIMEQQLQEVPYEPNAT